MAVLLVATGLVFWLAHAYSLLVGDRLHHAGLTRAEIRRVAGHEWPLFQAALPPAAAAPLLFAWVADRGAQGPAAPLNPSTRGGAVCQSYTTEVRSSRSATDRFSRLTVPSTTRSSTSGRRPGRWRISGRTYGDGCRAGTWCRAPSSPVSGRC